MVTTKPSACAAGQHSKELAAMDSLAPGFVWSDAWILLAIIFSHTKGGATLQEIVAVADFINHAIPTREELEGALNRLLAAGYITVRDETYDVTEPVMMAYTKATTPRRSVPKLLDDMHRFLASTSGMESCPRSITITESALENAYQNYQKQLGRLQQNLKRVRPA